MVSNIEAVRAAVEEAKVLAAEFHTATANFYEDGNTTPVFANVPVRVKKPRPSSFDAGNQTEWSTKRAIVIKAPMDLTPYGTPTIIRRGLIVQVSSPDGDPTINGINFIVQSALTSQFAAEREISVSTEINSTPRIV